MFKLFIDSDLPRFNAAVIGGGITGLTTAWKLSENARCSRVTLYEKSSRLGGCIQTESIPVDGGNVMFEAGPQSMRVKGPRAEASTGSHKDDPDLDRFLYCPDHLVRVPSWMPHLTPLQNIRQIADLLVREPVFGGLVWSILREPFKAPPKNYPDDESVAEFISRRFSPRIADNLASAMFHGIYAGDIDKLSANSVLGELRRREESQGSILTLSRKKSRDQSHLNSMTTYMASFNPMTDRPVTELVDRVQTTISQSFQNGMGQLVDGLVAALKKSKKVDIITNADVNGISKISGTPDLMVNFGQGKSRIHNRVIATNPAPDVARMLSNPNDGQPIPEESIQNLKTLNYAVSIMVVNLYYPEMNAVPYRGFGYLIPRSVPYEKNPERALGVVFGSGKSTKKTEPGLESSNVGTKLTVMLGGHLWDHFKEPDYPNHDQAVAMAKSVLERHMGITVEPTLTHSRLHRNGIPQYTVGHQARIKEVSRSVRSDFDKRLSLAGNWYNGVSVMDCIEQAYLASSFGMGDLLYCDEKDNIVDMEGGIVIPPLRWTDKKMPQAT
ncbi:Protoporphyrinogen oxidase [Aspergillus sclerotialis]|uniref:Protoporphyrinogen oxidase n=1 Tax=Aspergillus sclerotialis TaxID=2070753 RepID=A0A3A2ZTH2_9EURO|nr:Protoporphyrinogen oxidase [Aspergillus sclerotialis]